MLYVFVNYNYSPDFHSPEGWIKRTSGYTGVLECLSKENTVISIKQIYYKGNYLHNDVQHHFINLNTRKTYFPYALNRYVKNLNPDIVFIQGLHQPLQLIQLRLLLNKKVKIMAQHHAEKPFTGIKKHLQRLADRYVDAYLFASKALGMEWVGKCNLASPKKIHEVMEVSSVFYPIDKAEAKAKTKIKRQPVFLWVGRLNQNKDPLTVVKAFLKFLKKQSSARLYMIYHTDELLAEITKLLKGNADKDAVILIGKVPNNELLYWYNSADFIISGSHYEGSGTAVCEAMSCGCVPIVTDIFSFRMITDNGNCGILYEVGNEAALLSALMQTSELDMQEKRHKCLEYFRSNLSFEAIAQQIQDISASL
jgi:glycosyltransferase involved in cell wall biosynthesis